MPDKLLAHEEEVFKLAWGTAVLTAGGTVGLLLGEPTTLQSVFAVVGFSFTIALVVFIVSKDLYIRKLARREETETS
jgi:choline-glycine betaine transporter